jgi:hypothetical protein
VIDGDRILEMHGNRTCRRDSGRTWWIEGQAIAARCRRESRLNGGALWERAAAGDYGFRDYYQHSDRHQANEARERTGAKLTTGPCCVCHTIESGH